MGTQQSGGSPPGLLCRCVGQPDQRTKYDERREATANRERQTSECTGREQRNAKLREQHCTGSPKMLMGPKKEQDNFLTYQKQYFGPTFSQRKHGTGKKYYGDDKSERVVPRERRLAVHAG